MSHPEELRIIARSILDSNRYMTLATADETGLPWVSPVWYAPARYREFFWVCSQAVTRPAAESRSWRSRCYAARHSGWPHPQGSPVGPEATCSRQKSLQYSPC